MSITVDVNVSFKEIYKLLCPKCKKKVKDLVIQKISQKLADQVLEEG